jgi:hypothetical protein
MNSILAGPDRELRRLCGGIRDNVTEISASDVAWTRRAARLAQLKLPFVIVGFDPELDTAFSSALRDRFDLEVEIDPGSKRAQFSPKS